MTQKPRRILFVGHSPHRGGAEYCLHTILEHLDRSQFTPIVLFPDEGPMVEEAKALGCEVHVSPMCYWLYFNKDLWYWKNLFLNSGRNISAIQQIINDCQVDLVYTNTSAIFESAIAARKAKIPHFWHVHEVLDSSNGMQQLLPISLIKKLIVRWSSKVIFESHASRRFFDNFEPCQKFEVIYNSVRISDGSKSEITRTQFGFRENDFVIGIVGQLIDRKNPHLLIDAISRIEVKRNLKCLIVGEGPLHQPLQDQIQKESLSDVCSLIPFQEDISPFMAMIDVLVLPSRQESFGLVLVEAAHSGKPTIACRSQGPEEIIADGSTGILVPQDDSASLAKAIVKLRDSVELRESMGSCGRLRVSDLFHPHKNTKRLENLINNFFENNEKSPNTTGKQS